MADDKRDLLELLDLVRDQGLDHKSLRVSVRRLPSEKGQKSTTVASFYAEQAEELLETITEHIEAHGVTGDYEIRIREKTAGGFDQSCTERREFRERAPNPVPVAAPAAPAAGGLEQVLQALNVVKEFKRAMRELDAEDAGDDSDEEEEEEELSDADEREENPSSSTVGELIKDETVRTGIGRVVQAVSAAAEKGAEWVGHKAAKAEAEAAAAKPKPPPSTAASAETRQVPVVAGTIIPMRKPS